MLAKHNGKRGEAWVPYHVTFFRQDSRAYRVTWDWQDYGDDT